MGCILNSVTGAKDKCAPETGLRALPLYVQAEMYQLLHFQNVALREILFAFYPLLHLVGLTFFLCGGSVTVWGHTYFSSRSPYIAFLASEQSSLQYVTIA